MDKRKDVIVQVPTVEVKAEALPPKIVTTKKFLHWNWKYLVVTWVLTGASIPIGYFLLWPQGLIVGVLLSIIAFFFGTKAVTENTIKEITN